MRAEEALRRATDALDGDIPVETDAFVEDPADVLIRVSEHLDLLVCGSRGYGPLRAVLLGGVSRRLTAEAQCPGDRVAARRHLLAGVADGRVAGAASR